MNKHPSKPAFELPGYEVLEQVGHGAMATVWTARQVSLDRIVAIKFLSSHLLTDPEAIEQFRSESKAAAQLRHPGIVQVHDAGEHRGLFYYVMEFIAGCTVGELLKKKGRLDEKNALLIAEGVALALSYAWSTAQLIHCDIKPENVLIDSDGTIKVADLGLARIMGRYTVEKESEMISGTPNYISPEQAGGQPQLDSRTDIYSLGCMIYHMVNGKIPFAGQPERQILEQQCFGHLSDPADLRPDLSVEAAWLIEKMLVKDRNLRTSDWKEVLSDLQEVLNGNPPSLLPPAGQSTVRRGPRREGPPVKKKAALKPRVPAADAEPKQKIVLSGKDMKSYLSSSATRKKRSDLAGSVTTLLILAACAAGGYFGVRYWFADPAAPSAPEPKTYSEAGQLPPRSYVAGQTPPPAAAKLSGTRDRTQTPTHAAAAPQELPSWDHPEFQKAARQFNEALALYKQFQASRTDFKQLEQAEQLSRQAAATFESLAGKAPAGVHIEQLAQQCYHLIADCRHSTLLVNDPAKPRPAAASPAAGTATSTPAAGLSLAVNWNRLIEGNPQQLKDLKTVLSDWGSPSMDLSANPSLYLFAHITFLMPAPEAARLAGLKLPPRRPVACAGFPHDSFFYYTLRGDFGEGFRLLLLVTDKADQVVAVQLVNDKPDTSLWLDPQFFNDQWKTYDFIEGKTKANLQWKIAHRVTPLDRMIRIDSELVQNDSNGYFGLGDSKARSSLILPEQLVSLLLYHLQKNSPAKP